MSTHLTASVFLAGALALANSCSSGNSGGGAGSASFDCAVCNVVNFACDAGGVAATVSVPTVTANGCSGTIVSPDGTDPFWIHCDSGRVCAEHEDECFAATSTGTAFSYTSAGKGTVVSCNPS